jgi:FkbM family methyltransferase
MGADRMSVAEFESHRPWCMMRRHGGSCTCDARAYTAEVVARAYTAEVVQTPFGKFQIYPQDLIGSTTKAGTLWDGGLLQPLAREYGQLGESGRTIYDIGANIGTFSVWLAAHGAWRVIAVEAHPQVMLMLKANLDLNRDPCTSTVIPIEVAAYSHACQMRQGRPDPLPVDGNIGSHYVVEDPAGPIRAEALDAYRWLTGRGVSLIKVDAEGCDLPALQGLRATIEGDQPAIIFEWLPTALLYTLDHTWADVQAFFDGLGYVIHEWPALPSNYLACPQRIRR